MTTPDLCPKTMRYVADKYVAIADQCDESGINCPGSYFAAEATFWWERAKVYRSEAKRLRTLATRAERKRAAK